MALLSYYYTESSHNNMEIFIAYAFDTSLSATRSIYNIKDGIHFFQ